MGIAWYAALRLQNRAGLCFLDAILRTKLCFLDAIKQCGSSLLHLLSCHVPRQVIVTCFEHPCRMQEIYTFLY